MRMIVYFSQIIVQFQSRSYIFIQDRKPSVVIDKELKVSIKIVLSVKLIKSGKIVPFMILLSRSCFSDCSFQIVLSRSLHEN